MPETTQDTRPAVIVWNPAVAVDTGALQAHLASDGFSVLHLDGGTPADRRAGSRQASATERGMPGARKGAALLHAADKARRAGFTHLIWVDAECRASRQAVGTIREAAARQPCALIVGRWSPTPAGKTAHRCARSSRWARFWLKIQTGHSVYGLHSGLRVYPLAVLEHLKLRQKGDAVDLEVVVKTLWAGVPVAEVALGAAPPEAPPQKRLGLAAVYRLGLNIHYAMRAITPLPHRKLLADGCRPGQVVSVLHPWRSLRTLLGENVTPGRLAASGALGVFLGTLPLIACHTVATLFAANYFRLNKVAALSTSQLCMPPLVPALCIEAGYFMRHGRLLTEISLETLGYQAPARLLEWLLGSLVLAPVLALAAAGTILAMVAAISRAKGASTPNAAGHNPLES